MAQRISTVSGVAQVQVYGSQKYAVRIQVDPRELVSRGIGIDEVANAIQNGNVNMPTGTLYGAHKAFTLETSGQLVEANMYRPLIVTYRNGSPVRLSDVAVVTDSVQNNKTAAWYTDPKQMMRSVVLAVQRQPGTNTVEVAASVRRLLPLFQQQIPASAQLHVLFDRSESIKESVNDVKFTLFPRIDSGYHGDFLIPAEPLCNGNPRARIAALNYWNVFGHVFARLQFGQSFPDGVDAIGGICHRRRDRSVGKHRSPYGNGKKQMAGGSGWLQRSRLHNHIYDHFPGRRLYSGAIYRVELSDGFSMNLQ